MSCLSPAWRSGESRPDEVMVLTFVHRVVEEEIRFVLIKAPQPDDVSERPGIRCRADKMKGNDDQAKRALTTLCYGFTMDCVWRMQNLADGKNCVRSDASMARSL
jgi:hypothetical protein